MIFFDRYLVYTVRLYSMKRYARALWKLSNFSINYRIILLFTIFYLLSHHIFGFKLSLFYFIKLYSLHVALIRNRTMRFFTCILLLVSSNTISCCNILKKIIIHPVYSVRYIELIFYRISLVAEQRKATRFKF